MRRRTLEENLARAIEAVKKQPPATKVRFSGQFVYR